MFFFRQNMVCLKDYFHHGGEVSDGNDYFDAG